MGYSKTGTVVLVFAATHGHIGLQHITTAMKLVKIV